jgi:serine/threonine-protein kinase
MASIPTQSDPMRDRRLADLLAELTEQARQGRPPDLESMAAAHPDLGAELRELWAAAQFAEEFTRPTPRARASPATPLGGALPRTFGDFELLEELGRGGMGVVYKARQISLNRIVALKCVLGGEHASPADQARFQVEAQAAAHLQHPNIVAVYQTGECEGQPYFSMRYIEGQTLSALLARGPLRAQEAARLLATVSRAVHYAHSQGILHRDLKPSNVLIDQAGEPHITDFGLAKRVPRVEGAPVAGLTVSGAIVGTPNYMAPEQISDRRGKVGPVSDVYSLGVILYEMLTGRPPFQAASQVDTLLLVLEQDPIRPRLLNPKVDPDLELICLKCLQKEPELRYASAADLAADLEKVVNDEAPSVRVFGVKDVPRLLGLMLRETHNAVVLENWGVLWMCHSGAVFLQCVLTTAMKWNGVANPAWYLLLWGGGLMVWGAIFWWLRKRGGPVLFIERQIAHVWGGAILATVSVFFVEMLLGLPVLALAPMLAVIAGMVFIVKAGMFSGSFYVWAAALFVTAIPMALYPDYGILLFGFMSAACFFVPGLKYYRQRARSLQAAKTTEVANV